MLFLHITQFDSQEMHQLKTNDIFFKLNLNARYQGKPLFKKIFQF